MHGGNERVKIQLLPNFATQDEIQSPAVPPKHDALYPCRTSKSATATDPSFTVFTIISPLSSLTSISSHLSDHNRGRKLSGGCRLFISVCRIETVYQIYGDAATAGAGVGEGVGAGVAAGV